MNLHSCFRKNTVLALSGFLVVLLAVGCNRGSNVSASGVTTQNITGGTYEENVYAQDLNDLRTDEDVLSSVGFKFVSEVDGSVHWDQEAQARTPDRRQSKELRTYSDLAINFLRKYTGRFGLRHQDGSVESVQLPVRLVDRLNRKLKLVNEAIQSSI